MTSSSVASCAAEWGLLPIITKNLMDDSSKQPITDFFPVQMDVIPILLRQNHHKYLEPRDLCVSAPTGSGKTIAFAVPIIHTIENEKSTNTRYN